MIVEDLLQRFTLVDILIMLVLVGLAIKEVVSLYDWFKTRFNKPIKDKIIEYQGVKNTEAKIAEMDGQLKQMFNLVQILIDSDKDDIKAWITQQHHYFCYQLGHIDDFSLDCIEKRYDHYREENGNSFVSDMMADIRALPRASSAASVRKN